MALEGVFPHDTVTTALLDIAHQVLQKQREIHQILKKQRDFQTFMLQ